ncbi:MAG TPA: acyl-CoA dehydrogenase family protein [Polyangiales bacterium]|nr:acyl-CoA dehydrogenase family protein [Polyangiales bacterium]
MDAGSQSSARAQRRERAAQLAREVVRPAAADVDSQARFPKEALAALRAERLLGIAVPTALGGEGASLSELAEICTLLGEQCSASAMVFAMHQIQVACIVRHGQEAAFFRDYLKQLVAEQRLIASVTSEVGIGGDLRSSITSVEPNDRGFILNKNASTISYGEHTDDLLITARRAPDSPANDQVLVLLRSGDYRLEKKSAWDTLGMRGTCSPAFRMEGGGSLDQVLPDFPTIASATMVPFSHALWASVWLGIASDAVARARAMVRGQARKAPGTIPPTALRLAEVNTELDALRFIVRGFIDQFERIVAQPNGGIEELSSLGFALQANQLKVSASERAVNIVSRVMMLCGIAGYRNDSKESVGRHLRDVYSSLLMIANDRIHATNAQLLLVYKG